jgi:hypothetical protein
MSIHIYSKLISELKSNNESMIKNNKTTNFGYGNKVFQKSKFYHIPLKLHVL